MSVPPDEHLPQRLRAQEFIREGEETIGRTWFRSLSRFVDRVRPAVTGGDVLDPGRVSDHQPFWTNEVDSHILPEVGNVLTRAWRRVTGAGQPEQDSGTSDYLNKAGNRLKNLPDEIYALIVVEIERGIREGLSHDKITEAVDQILIANATERWKNRARTIARTETMGAVNAGIYRAAVVEAERRGDIAPFKQWLSTEDARTRPTHVSADKQRAPLESPFRVGTAQLLFPGDPFGPAKEVINCRCTMLPIILGETIDWTDRQRPRG